MNQNDRRRKENEFIVFRRILKINWIFLITLVTTVSHIKRLYLATKSIRIFQKLQASKAQLIQKKFKDHLVKSNRKSKENYLSCSVG